MIDFAAIDSALYERAESDSAGAALRALLGAFPATFPRAPGRAGDAAIFRASLLPTYAGAGVTLPWLVWRQIPGSGQRGNMVGVNGSWWAYQHPTADASGLLTIASAVYALYAAPFSIAGGRLVIYPPRTAAIDDALSLRGVEIPLTFRQLG